TWMRSSASSTSFGRTGDAGLHSPLSRPGRHFRGVALRKQPAILPVFCGPVSITDRRGVPVPAVEPPAETLKEDAMTAHLSRSLLPAAVLTCLALSPAGVCAQGLGGPTVRDSNAGYIDPAIPGDQVRLRYDTAYNNRTANRAEFFYPAARPRGSGLWRPEPSIDAHGPTAYLQPTLHERFSRLVG